MASRDRFMSAKEFGALIADLRLTPTLFQNGLLEFFEHERIVVPVVRVCWPNSMILESRDVVSDPPPTQAERDATQALSDALRLWRRFDADPELPHPFDLGAQAPGAALITTDVASQEFVDWADFRTNIRGPGQDPLYISDGVDTYYHDWQVLLVADALMMGVHVIFDTRKPELLKQAVSGRLSDIPAKMTRSIVSFEGSRGLTKGLEWALWFDAAAKVEAVRSRKLTAVSMGHNGHTFTLEGAELADFNAVQKRSAERALAAIAGTCDDARSFLIYLCERWDEWSRRGGNEVAGEYKRQIGLALRMVMLAFDTDFKALAVGVGRATGHFANTLDVIFPDWKHDARDKAELSLKHSVVAKAPTADAALTLDDAAITDLLDWLERTDQWKVHLSIEAILKHQFGASSVDHSALAKEVESLSTTFEHLANALLDEAGVSSPAALMKKVQAFWNTSTEVHGILTTQYALVGTKTATRADRLAAIAALTPSGPNIDVARTILAAVLYRNDGLHNGMASWVEPELHEAARIFLTAMMFCRKNLLVSPPSP
ncbi:hypothetical protein [Rhizobium leguminosarum]|uniref:hypothetical protein n=1 Tax=Rhizobium leguminosarum TaxID=384 RepID=UPI000DE56617|nr:hypothetical protein [Rhizobium leguminosarum]MBY5421050.1 hypothetical protein [Rhizobium leguminosarum]MBY5791458.1 hypothetical protein [Rhizobium leguminosarum]NKL87566.1 hypothetical protein [Rhizobium leguminosarum bv. viciae]